MDEMHSLWLFIKPDKGIIKKKTNIELKSYHFKYTFVVKSET